ncbi:MAG: ATP-binding cassette domain-containing protein [Clostridia bacterium]|nr:ATP-binding cassette domain-containing protein [Clostridia bacterium]
MALSVSIEKKLGDFRLAVALETDGAPLGLLGASGSGKSVTLQCIAGTMRPDKGRIVLNGRVLFDSERRICLPPQKRNVGYLFQQYALFPNMTVEQNIFAGVRSGSRAEKRAVVQTALRTYQLTEVAKQYPKTLSGGQQQRTALARILVGKPELLLLDEPFSALDSFLKGQLMWELQNVLASYSGDVLFVSHARDEIRLFCPRVSVLNDGRSEPIAAIETLLTAPQTVSAARLAGYRNIFPLQRINAQQAHLPPLSLTLSLPETDGAAACCIPDAALSVVAPDTQGAIRCEVRGALYTDEKRLLQLHPSDAPEDALLCLCTADTPDGCADSGIWITIDETKVFSLKM